MKKKNKISTISKIITDKAFSIFIVGLFIIIVPVKTLCIDSTVYNGCYDVESGSFRFVENTEECSKNEKIVSFSEEMIKNQKDIRKYDLDELLKCVEKEEKRSNRKCVKICPRDARHCLWYCCNRDGSNCRISRVVTW